METEKALTGIFNKNHLDIKEQFKSRLIDLLKRDNLELKAYAIEDDYYNRESLKMVVDNTEIEVTIRAKV